MVKARNSTELWPIASRLQWFPEPIAQRYPEIRSMAWLTLAKPQNQSKQRTKRKGNLRYDGLHCKTLFFFQTRQHALVVIPNVVIGAALQALLDFVVREGRGVADLESHSFAVLVGPDDPLTPVLAANHFS